MLISNQILLLEIPLITPFSPSITSAHIFGEGRQVIIKSTFSASSFADVITPAPLSAKSFVSLLSKSFTVKSNLFLNKLPASFPPTFPRPIKPIFITTSLILMNIKNLMVYFFFKNVFNKNRAEVQS